jgi:hypothetical protein
MRQYNFSLQTIFFVVIISFFSKNAKAQESTANKYTPNIFTASPQVASMSKVGEIPIDISTGRINYTIPIYEIQEGNFIMPINLSYNYSGLLLDETPGYGGVGWTFNIGGSILHSINGLNDESFQNNKVYIDAYVNKTPPFDTSSIATDVLISHLLEDISNGLKDGEPDKYTINVGNINCSFYLDKNSNPIFLKNENYKITGHPSIGFILIDDKGITYIFNQPVKANKVSNDGEVSDYTSSLLLTEINFPYSKNKITFEYDTNIGNGYSDTNISRTLIKTTNALGNPNNNFQIRTNNTTIISGNINLKKITTAKTTIELGYNPNPIEPNIVVIKNLSIKNNLGSLIKNYDFSYSNWLGRRCNLLNVVYNGQITNQMQYDMTVNYPDTASLDNYYKKDLWGYYNENVTLPESVFLQSPDDNPTIKPDFNSTKIGALKKITYQTKGYSLIDYEANMVYMSSGEYNFPYDADGTIFSGFSAKTDVNNGISNDKTFIVNTVPAQLDILYNLYNRPEINPSEDIRYTDVILFKEGNEENPLFYTKQDWIRELTWIPVKQTKSGNQKIEISTPGTYHLKASSTFGASASISVSLKQRPATFNQTVGGIRVKQVQNCDFNGQCITTVYNYSQNSNSTGIMLQSPKFSSGYFIQDNRFCRPSIYAKMEYFNFSSIYPLSNFRGSPVLYKTVEKTDVAEGVNNGKTIFSYLGNPVSNSLRNEEAYLSIGRLDKKIVKDQVNTTIEKQKNGYLKIQNPDASKYVYTLESKYLMEIRSSNSGSTAGGCASIYPIPKNRFSTAWRTIRPNNYKLEKEEITNYFKADSLAQATSYNYNLGTGATTSQTTTNSNNETLESKYFYPQDLPSEPFVTDLIAKNMIAIPLKTESYKNTEKLSEKLTEYTKTADNLLLPKFIYANKGTATIDKNRDRKITFDQYDDKGNTLQYTQESGVPVTIIWGYNKTLPVAKIENATYAQVEALLGGAGFVVTDGLSATQETALRTGLPNAMVTTYTHIPLVGVSTITDPKGDKITYEYDGFNRLKWVLDKNGNKLSENEYHYKN